MPPLPIFPYTPPPMPLPQPSLGLPVSMPPANPYNAAANLAAAQAGGQAAGNPYLSPLQALVSGALNGYGAGQATRQQQQATAQQQIAQNSLKMYLADRQYDGKEDPAVTRANASDYAAASRQFTQMYGINTRASGLSDEMYNKGLTAITQGLGSGLLTPELAQVMITHLRGGGPAGQSPAADPSADGTGSAAPGGVPPEMKDFGRSTPLTDSTGNKLPGQGASSGAGFGLSDLRQMTAPQAGPSASPPSASPAPAALPPAGGMPAQAPPALPAGSVPSALPSQAPGGILAAIQAGNRAAAPALPAAAPAAPLAAPAPPPGPLPAPVAGTLPAGAAPALPSANPFAGLGPGPKAAADIAKTNAGVAHVNNLDAATFAKMVGLLPPAQQPGFVQHFNLVNGTSFAVPGTPLPLPAGIAGPVGVVPSYDPDRLIAATIRGKGASANLAQAQADSIPKKLDLQALTAGQRSAFQQRVLALKARGLSDTEAYHQSQLELGQGRLALSQDKYTNPVSGGAGGKDPLGMVDKEIARVTKPGRATFDAGSGNMVPGPSLASTPEGQQYLQHLQNQRQRVLHGQGAVVPGQTPGYTAHVGSAVRSVAPPAAGLGPLPPIRPALRPAASGTPAQARQRLLKTLGMGH